MITNGEAATFKASRYPLERESAGVRNSPVNALGEAIRVQGT